jgi:hypothetical protein
MVCACCNLDGCPQKGACCKDGECIDYLSESECNDLGGTWQGCCVRCHPTFNASTGLFVYPCGDTSTDTCCEVLWSRFSQVVVTIEDASGPSSPPPEIADIDCACFNGTYIVDGDDFISNNEGGIYSLNDIDVEECESVPAPQPPPPFYTNFNDSIFVNGQLGCFSQQRSSDPSSDLVGVLRMSVTGTLRILQETRADFGFGTQELVAGAELNGGAETDLLSVPCEQDCEDLVDDIVELFPLTGSMAAGSLFLVNNQCKSPSDATITFDLQ